MSELSVGRMTAAVVDWPDPGQVLGMLRHVADSRLDDALREQPLPDGEWCVRHLDIAVQLDPERPLSALETGWADLIITTLRQSLRDGSSDVVRFERPEDAIDDLFAGLVSHDWEHAWAWRQVGLIEPGDPLPEDDARGLFLTVLPRLRHGAAGAIVRLVATVGVASVHRLLGADGWRQTAVVASRDAGAVWSPASSPESRPTSEATTDLLGEAHTAGGQRRRGAPADSALDTLGTAVAASGSLAPAFRRSSLRIDSSTLEAWAVLAIAAVDPVLLRRPEESVRVLVRAVAGRLRPEPRQGISLPSSHAGRSAHDARGDESSIPVTGVPTVHDAVPAATAPEDAPVEEDPARIGLRTSWGGLLFLFNTAGEAGIPEALDEAPFLARPSGWVLHRLARRLIPAAPDDPALLGFAGLDDPPFDEADEIEEQALMLCAARWAQHTADRLRATGTEGLSDPGVVHRIARRDAIVAREPGWIEVSLPLTGVDLDVRRAGLDIDPGWVRWLGRVVRFRYE